MLLALSSAARQSELQALDLNYMRDKGNEIEFQIEGLTKVRKPGDPPKKVSLAKFTENKNIDVVDCLRTYILRTREWRKTGKQNRLLLSTIKPHKPYHTSTSTIAGWLKTVMKM